MKRNQLIEGIFTTADDQMQGLWGLHRYLKAAMHIAQPDAVVQLLPREIFPLTHEWGRFYDPKEMVREVTEMGEFLLARQSLVALVTVWEAALLRLNETLASLGKCAPKQKIMGLLKWAFRAVQSSPVASAEAIARLPQTSGDLDNARRLRNCIVHRNGCFDEEMYCRQVIEDGWVRPQYENGYLGAVAARERIFIDSERFECFLRSHIEFLHCLHNTIQKNEFGCSVPYNYADENKRIEWYRILSGRLAVGM